MPSIYTIIVTYNGEKWIKECLKTVAESSFKTNIIVVDNNSKDKTLNIIEKEFPNVILLKQTSNLGFGGGNNFGIKYALDNGADFVFLINQDVYIEPNTIEHLVSAQKKNPEYGIVSPIHLNGKGNKLDRNFSHYISYEYNNTFQFDAIKSQFSEIYKLPFVNAAAWLVPKSTLTKIGGFDPLFFHYGEDDNYCQRLKYHDLKVGVIPNAFILHDREQVLDEKQINTDSLKEKEKQFKIKWANINIENRPAISQKISYLENTLKKAYLKLNFKTVNSCKAEIRLINSIKKEINLSRVTNQKEGQHYL